jgi:hypothetical protein
MKDLPLSLWRINKISPTKGEGAFRGYKKQEKGEKTKMKKNTIVVLEKGNDCAFEGPLGTCCMTTLVPIA